MLKDVAGTGGLKVHSMYVSTFGYDMSTVAETKGPTDMFATMWAVQMLNLLGLSDIILQCDPEPSLIKWAESVDGHIKAMEESKIIRNSCRDRCEQCWQQMQEHTQYRPSADNALM